MIPAIVLLFYLLPYPWGDTAACAAFALAGITDSLDGYYARKLGLTSRLGAFLDPVADKLIVAAALILIVSRDPRWFMAIAAIVIIGREIAISALREWMAEIGALFGIPFYKMGIILIAIAVVLTLWSMIGYLRVAWPELRGSSSL
jgi:CDP-diacylglycerol--glycerol-3-phosphate 3-phosphatidyltransferase